MCPPSLREGIPKTDDSFASVGDPPPIPGARQHSVRSESILRRTVRSQVLDLAARRGVEATLGDLTEQREPHVLAWLVDESQALGAGG